MPNNRLKLIEEMLLEDPTDPFLLYAAALEYKKMGNDILVISQLESLVATHPTYLGSYYLLGKFYEEKNQVNKAIDIYKKGKEIAKLNGDNKILRELNEALFILEDQE